MARKHPAAARSLARQQKRQAFGLLRCIRGGAALEFMLVLPSLLLVLVGMLAISSFLTTRYYLGTAAVHAARTCTVLRRTNLNCAQADVQSYLPADVRGRCAGLQVTATTVPLQGTTVSMFDVDLRCTYNGPLGTLLLNTQGIQLGTLQARGSMPIQ